MSTRSFIHPTRFMQALLILSLCFILAGSLFADRPDNRDRGKNNRPGISKRQPVSKNNTRPDRHANGQDKSKGRERSRYNGRPKNYQPPVRKVTVQYRYPSRPNYRPAHYTHWIFDIRNTPNCRRSVYFYFGYLPYVSAARIYVEPYVYVEYRSAPIIFSGGYYLHRQHTTQLDDTLADIRSAWLDGRVDLIKRHIGSSGRIAVLLDGKYDYSVDSGDYADMTNDAIDQMDTVGFVWESVRQRTNGDYTAFAKHTYVDDSSQQKLVYVRYTLDRYYNIVEVGSSESPVNHY
jgi:hypothetical protein